MFPLITDPWLITGPWPLPESPNDPSANLRYALEQRGLSQHALAEATGIDQATLSRLCAGKREFNADHIKRLAAYFKKDPSLFL